MHAGHLRTRIEIEQRTPGQDGAGQPVDVWTRLARVPADVRVTGGLEAIRAGGDASLIRASARIRWRTDVTAQMRVMVDGAPWNVKAVLPDVATRRWVDLVLERAT